MEKALLKFVRIKILCLAISINFFAFALRHVAFLLNLWHLPLGLLPLRCFVREKFERDERRQRQKQDEASHAFYGMNFAYSLRQHKPFCLPCFYRVRVFSPKEKNHSWTCFLIWSNFTEFAQNFKKFLWIHPIYAKEIFTRLLKGGGWARKSKWAQKRFLWKYLEYIYFLVFSPFPPVLIWVTVFKLS